MTDVKALEALFECQDQVIIFSDENGHVTCVNDFARLLLKRKPTDITGKPLWHLFSEDELHATVPVLKKMMQQAARRGKAKELIMLQAEEGLPIFFDCIIRPFFAQPAMLAGYLCRLTDVTLFENEKNELLDNLTRHELVTKASQEGLWDWMVKEDKVYFSPKFKELMGYPPSTYIDGMNALLTVLHPDDVERTVAALQAHLQERKPFLIDYRLKTISQSYRWFRVYGQAIWNEEGEAIRMAGSVVDVHESKLQQEEIATANSLLQRNQEMLQQTIERLQATFMSLPDYVFELNAETKLVKIHNLPSHLSTFGVLATEGTPLSQLFDKITVEQVEKCIEKVRKSGQSERIEVSARRYGLQCEAEITVTPIQHQHLLCIFRDISEQKKAEFERNKSELRFSRLMENMSIGLLEVDIDEKIVQASPRFVEMSGYTLEELQNKHVWELMISTDKVGANYKYELLNRRKISKGPFEQRIRTKNGEILDLQISGAPLYDIHGNLVGHSGLHIDVTERNKERRLFQQVRELATMGIFIIDLEKNDIFWDDITRSIFEVEEAFEPTIENGIDFYKEGDSRNRISQAVEEAIVDGKGCNGIFEIVTALGNTKWIRVVAYTEKIKTRVVKIVGHTIDITREKLQEIKIQQLNEHYEAISAATSQMLFRWTLDTDIIEFNEVFQTVTGYNNKIPPLNLGHSLLKNIHPDDYQSLKANLHNAIEKKQLLTCRYRFLVSSGQYRHMAANVVALYNERGKVEKLIGTIEDITAHVELQEELNRQKIETQKRLDEAAMVVEQQERHFIGQELHDNACQLLVSASLYLKKAKKQRYQQQETMEEVEDLLQQCLKDIRGLSHRLASENMLEHGLHQALLDLQKRMSGLTNTQLLLEVDLVEESTIHSSLQMLLYRICQEMLSNVIKYSNASKCTIQLHTIGQQEVQLTISDNGKGFNMKTVQKGLGLQHTIKRVVAFGGHYDIQAYEGKGCTITFSVPLQHLIKS